MKETHKLPSFLHDLQCFLSMKPSCPSVVEAQRGSRLLLTKRSPAASRKPGVRRARERHITHLACPELSDARELSACGLLQMIGVW